jgi:hypothetical protein
MSSTISSGLWLGIARETAQVSDASDRIETARLA